MTPIQHRTSNAVLQAPPGAKREECRALYITRFVWAHGAPAVASYWQPSEEERRLIAAGAAVRISFDHPTHPPVFVGVDGDGLI
jgi:hypothetical protein